MPNDTNTCKFCKENHRYTGFIYIWRNKVNSKWYLGSHYGCLEDGYIGSGVIFKKALAVHGIGNFTREILAHTWCSRRELLQVEEDLLIELDARGDALSYNTKNKGLGQDPEVARKIFLGKKQSEVQKENRRKTIIAEKTFTGEKNGRAKEIVCLETEEVFAYARLAAKATDGHEVGISEACTKGYSHRNRYWMFVSDWISAGKPKKHPKTKPRELHVVRLTDGVVFESASDAARKHNVTPGSISLACSEQHRTSAGHHWMLYHLWTQSGGELKSPTFFNRSAGAIIDSETSVVYASAMDCAKCVGLSDVSIMKQAKGITKQRRYFFLADWEALGHKPTSVENRRAKRSIIREDSGKVFDSISAAAKSVNGTVSGVSAAISESRTYKGVLFKKIS